MEAPAISNKPRSDQAPDYADVRARAVVGFMCAPFITATIGALAIAAAHPFLRTGDIRADAEVGFSLGLAFAYGETIIVGIPVYLLFRYRRITSLRAYAVTSFALGLLLPAIFLFDNPHGPILGWLWTAALMGSAGCASGVAFWLIARPDKYVQTRISR